MFEDKKAEIEELFKAASDNARAFNESLMAMRSVEFPNLEECNNEERNELIKIGRDLDMRTAFLLRSLLVQHGNVLWL